MRVPSAWTIVGEPEDRREARHAAHVAAADGG
jgi:hypothetical protein